MTGRAQTAYKQLSDTTRAEYEECKKGLQERFEPACKKDLYLAEFQTRRKRREEDWASYADDLRVLADKAFPGLQREAKELLTLTHFLGQIDNPQIAVGVKQQRPKKLDAAVTAVLEMESYLLPRTKTGRVMQVEKDESSPSLVAGVQTKQDAMMEMLTQVMQRLDRLEKDRNARETPPTNERESTGKRDKEAPSRSGERRQQPRSPIICRRCHKEGHFARGCAEPRPSHQGN